MNRLDFQVLTPGGPVFHGEVEHAGLCGVDGELGVMAGHAPMLVGCRAGCIRLRISEHETRVLAAAAGLLSIGAEGAALLTMRAEAVPDEWAGRRLVATWEAAGAS